MNYQQDLLKHQDDQLDEIGEIAKRLNNHARTINQELKDHGDMLGKLDAEVDENLEKMNFVMKKLAKLMKTSGKG